MDEHELIEVLRNSLYPGAQDGSIKMIIGYCRASGLDPMQKPAHIVPIWDAKAKEMRDVVMPGIGLYRTQAARSGTYAGVTEPEFGPDVTESLGGVSVTYPAWCKVIVKRSMPNGTIVEFAAVERWKENYATQKRDSDAPNAMWKKRPYGQLAKCTEAQALRKAFPEFGSAPTADEMEGKEIYAERDITPAKPEPKPVAHYPDDDFEKNLPSWVRMISEGKASADQIIAKVQSKGPLTGEQVAKLREHETVIDSESQ
ncbi:MAG: phage recombination protein Bet [Pseudomonadota bacterium]|nr:phage recombination protein Bet [Pseudomonadota bacterium]